MNNDEARKSRPRQSTTPQFYGGMRKTEILTLKWPQFNFAKRFVQTWRGKTEGSEGRIIPLSSILLEALLEYRAWYEEEFGEIQPSWYVLPWGKPYPCDPTRHVASLKTSWTNVRKTPKWGALARHSAYACRRTRRERRRRSDHLGWKPSAMRSSPW